MKNKILKSCIPFALLFAGCSINAEEPVSTPETVHVTSEANDTSETKTSSSMDVDKQETVIAKANADGSIYETTVEVTLKHNEDEIIEDESNLTSIKNTSGNEEYTQDGTNISWENKGEDIHYKGSTTESLPVQLVASYKLNGEDASYEKMKNVNGTVEIKYSFTNLEKDEDVYVPFVTITLFMLDEEQCSDITINNGKIIHQDDMLVAVGYTTPQFEENFHLDSDIQDELDFPDSFTLKFDAHNYTLDSSSTIITNTLFEDLDDADLQDLIDMESDLSDFKDAGDKLYDGMSQYNDSMNTVSSYSSQFLEGLGSLAEGSASLDDGLQQVNNNMPSLTDGMSSLLEGLNSLNDNLPNSEDTEALSTSVTTLLTQLNAILTNVNGKVSELNTTIDAYNSSLTSLDELKTLIQNNATLTEEEKTEMLAKIPDSLSLVEPMGTDDVVALQESVQTLAQSFSGMSQLTELKTYVEQLITGASGIQTGVGTLASAINSLSSGSSQLTTGINTLKESYEQMDSGISSLNTASNSILEGFKTYKQEGVEELISQVKNLSTLGKDLKKIKEADMSYTSFTGLKEGKTCSTMFLLETDSLSD